jgi:serine/threonine-protein kinase
VYEDTTLLGTSRAERLMLPAGRHQLRLVASALNFETPVTVDVQAGRTVTTRVAVPNGTISLNALPWANVWVDGQAHGTTPIANMAIPIGSHEVIWRHPQLGERRQTIVVTAKSPVRLVVDMRQ